MNKKKHLVKYRTWYKGIPPKPIKTPIPGWAGTSLKHSSGHPPQPWHCIPFLEASTYGLEIIYPFEEQCIIRTENGKVVFENNFVNGKDIWFDKGIHDKGPFSAFAPGHYGLTSSLDIIPPKDHVVRLESHPRFFTDTTGTVPIVVPGHLRSEWWPRFFFIVFKAPLEGQYHLFKKNDPIAQIIFVPGDVCYDIQQMSEPEASTRKIREDKILKNQKSISSNEWKDNMGHVFNDKYKKLNTIFIKQGVEGVDEYLNSLRTKKVYKYVKTIKNKEKN